MTFARTTVPSSSGSNSPKGIGLGLVDPAAEEVQFFFGADWFSETSSHTRTFLIFKKCFLVDYFI
jgi:hypothetical protein